MFNQSTIVKFLHRRKSYRNAPWQRVLGLSSGGPAWRLSSSAPVPWGWSILVAPVVVALLLAFIDRSLLGIALSIVCLAWGYGLLVFFSAGYLSNRQLVEINDRMQKEPLLANACDPWFAEGQMLRTRDLWRLRLASWAFAQAARQMANRSHVLASVSSFQNAPPPLPGDLSPTEQARIEASLQKLTSSASPVPRSAVGRALLWPVGVICKMAPWDLLATRSWNNWATVLFVIVVQLRVAIELPIFIEDTSIWAGAPSWLIDCIMVLLINATLLLMPWRARVIPPADLWYVASNKIHQSPLVAWVLAQRAVAVDRISAADIMQSLRAASLLESYNKRKVAELTSKAYQSQLDRLPAIGASRARTQAQSLEDETPECEAAPPKRRL